MLPISKTVVAITGQSVTNAATVTGNIDRLGFNYCELDVLLAGGDAATNNPSVLKVSESDDTVVSNFADVTGLVGDTGFTIPNIGTDTAASTVVKFRLDLKKRKRYLKVTISPITTEILAAVAQLHKWEKAPVSTTDAGVATVVDL
ncbi:MAG: hypothetical protein BMS9Abin14_286 [Gammaproteobacteria bacterium]|nr:MAG: hypothetical protein BMS9Abin14_286 [Gammaproteobacteria bacterium]